MSLTIYSDFDEVKNKSNFVYDVCPLFDLYGPQDTPFARKVIKEVEMGEYLSDSLYKTRFGVCLYTDFLSVSSKALILAEREPNKIINFMEVGCDCTELVIDLTKGGIYIPKESILYYDWGFQDRPVNISYKGLAFNSNYEFTKFLEQEEDNLI